MAKPRPVPKWNLTGEAKIHGPKGLSQNAICRLTGLNPSTVSRALNCKRCGRKSMELIADAIGMSLDQFRDVYLREVAA